MIVAVNLGRVDYGETLAVQAEIGALVASGRLGNTLLLLEHPPVLTLGRHANRANILASEEVLAARGVTVHQINRGGDVTYHGPGQLIGYPIFDLGTLRTASGGRMGPVDFVRLMEEALMRVCGVYGVAAGRICGLAGVWCGVGAEDRDQGSGTKGLGTHCGIATAGRKIAAIGIHVARGITSHGFAFNVTTDLGGFALIHPCGITDKPVTSLQNEMAARVAPSLEAVADEAARQFGLVFGEQVLAMESLDALRAQARAVRFPAEDTPLRIPGEVERLLGAEERAIRA